MTNEAQDMEWRFAYHPPKNEDVATKHSFVRARLKGVALDFARDLPAGRETSLCITKLEEAMFWANAAIARNEN